jgi:hypothetical protein
MTTRHTVPVMTSRLEAPDDDPDALILGPAAVVSAPSGPVVRLHITVMARPAFIRIGLCWFACQSALALALGIWFADRREHPPVPRPDPAQPISIAANGERAVPERN